MTESVIQDFRRECDETIAALRKDLSRTRTGRASAALLDGIVVDYYGSRTALNQLAGVSAPEPRLLVVTPYDRSALGAIEKALQTSDLGINPMNDGKLLRVPLPPMTEERRREVVKHVRKLGEDYRVSIRGHRRDAIDLLKAMEKDKEISTDDLHKAQEKVQKGTDEAIKVVDEILVKKEAEIMEV